MTTEQLRWLKAIEKDGVNLTAFELEFMRKMRLAARHGTELSDKQARILESIYAERTP